METLDPGTGPVWTPGAITQGNKTFSYPTQLNTKFQLLMKNKMMKNNFFISTKPKAQERYLYGNDSASIIVVVRPHFQSSI